MPLRFKHSRIGSNNSPTVYNYATADGYNKIDICISDVEGVQLNNSLILAQVTLLANDGAPTTCGGASIRRAIYKIRNGYVAPGFPKQEADYWSSNGVHPPPTISPLTPTQTTPFQFNCYSIISDPIPTDPYNALYPIRQTYFSSSVSSGNIYLNVIYSVIMACQVSWEIDLDVFNPV